jgi:hypothetical protein
MEALEFILSARRAKDISPGQRDKVCAPRLASYIRDQDTLFCYDVKSK